MILLMDYTTELWSDLFNYLVSSQDESFYEGPPGSPMMELCSNEITNSLENLKTVTVAPYSLLVPKQEGLTFNLDISDNTSLTDVLNSALHVQDPLLTQGQEPALSTFNTVDVDSLWDNKSETTMSESNMSENEKPSRSNSPKNSKSPTVLPPCRVCSDTASGFHYGAYTCEACKVFYRRSLKKTVPYKCSKGGNCEIVPHKRLTCSYCRLLKCAAVGMSRQSIKRGRYTLEKKTDCIREVKKLQQKGEASPESEPIRSPENVVSRRVIDNSPESFPTPSPKEALDDLSILYEEVIKKLVRNSEKFNTYSREILDNIESSHAKHLEDLKAIEDVFGPMKCLSQEEYNDLYNCTGIDIDGRMREVQSHLPNLELRIQHLVGFAKTLPGFKEFTVEDQIKLIKTAGFDYFMLLSFAAMNVEHRLYTCACGHTRTEKELGRFVPVEMIEWMFKSAGHLQKLEMTPEELGLLKAYCILSTDRPELQEPEKVEKSFNMINECLLYYLKKYRADDEGFIGRLVSALLSIRTSTHYHNVHIIKMFENFSVNLEFPPLMLELLAS